MTKLYKYILLILIVSLAKSNKFIRMKSSSFWSNSKLSSFSKSKGSLFMGTFIDSLLNYAAILFYIFYCILTSRVVYGGIFFWRITIISSLLA